MCKSFIVALLCASLTTIGCASASRPRVARVSSTLPQDRAVLAAYVQRIAAGSRVRVEHSGGKVLRGTLMQATDDAIVVQEHTRIPERPLDIPLSDVARVTLDGKPSSSVAKTIGIGVASGVGATLAVFAILASMWSD